MEWEQRLRRWCRRRPLMSWMGRSAASQALRYPCPTPRTSRRQRCPAWRTLCGWCAVSSTS
ncbi:hypothetical protein HaLaN_07442, partial [Haematococcus lacustris]